MKKVYVALILVAFSTTAFTQARLSTKSKKAAEYYYEADNYWVRGQYAAASSLLQEALEKDKNFYEAYFRLGVIDKAKGNIASAETYLLKTLELNEQHAGANFELGELYIQSGEYEKSITYTKKFLALNPSNQKRKSEALKFIESAEFALKNIEQASEIDPQPLPDYINQFAMQYFPVITPDEEYLIYTRRFGTTLNHDEDLVVAKKQPNGEWGQPESISDHINSSFNEGTCTVSADGRTLIFTSCYGRNGYGSCDLYISRKTGEDWSSPENLGPAVNSPAWDSQPSLSADGRTLYFISNRPGGVGKRDIWVSSLNEEDVWGKPKNMGSLINTPEDEVSPFIHSNGSTLYFATNGRKGFGGFDIFYVEKIDQDWSEPVNMGYPINTGEDQVSLFITADGSRGYYSHEKLNDPEKKGEIYQFNIPQDLQVKYKASYVKGRVYNEKTGEPLAAQIELYDLKQGKRVAKVLSDSINGNYLMVLPEGSEYAFYVNKKDFLFKSLSFVYESDPLHIDIPLNGIEKGSKTVLQNIFFDFDKFELKQESKTELQKVVAFLKANPRINIEISGHTDNQGTEQYNLILSEKRAKSVYDYLINNEINKSRISFKGYGQSRPIATNDTEEGKEQNRRIEFEILN